MKVNEPRFRRLLSALTLLTWHESLPPSGSPAQSMLSVRVEYAALQVLVDTMGTLTSCSVPGNGRGTVNAKTQRQRERTVPTTGSATRKQ